MRCALLYEDVLNGLFRVSRRQFAAPGLLSMPDTALIFDCGSGFTRAKCFWRDDSNRVNSCEAHARVGLQKPFTLPRIVDVLIEGGSTLRDWVLGIRKLMEATGPTTTIIGATGGLRQAQADGRVTSDMVASLRELLGELTPSAEFDCLSGEEEARAELEGVQYVADLALPSHAPRPVGMMSGGGMTSQIGWFEAGSLPRLISVTHGLNGAVASLLEQSNSSIAGRRRSVLETFEARMAKEVSASGSAGKLRGTFVAIEMIGAVGSPDEYGGLFSTLAQKIGRRLLTKAELVAELQEHRNSWVLQDGLLRNRHEAYVGLLPAELLALTRLADEAALFYVCRAFEVPPGLLLKPSWSLGLFVSRSPSPPTKKRRKIVTNDSQVRGTHREIDSV